MILTEMTPLSTIQYIKRDDLEYMFSTAVIGYEYWEVYKAEDTYYKLLVKVK